MLQDDRHFLGMAGAQVVGDLDPREIRPEGQIEMVAARQALRRGHVQRLADDVAQRVFDHSVVLERVVAHGSGVLPVLALLVGRRPRLSGGLLLPGAPRTALT